MKSQLLTACFLAIALLPASGAGAQQARLLLPVPEGFSETVKPGAQKTAPAFECIDHTGDSLVVGYLPLEAGNNDRIAVVTPVLKTGWLQALAADGAARQFALRGSKGVYVLNDLSVGKNATGSYIRLKAHVYESPQGSDAYHLINRIDTLVLDPALDIKEIGAGIVSLVSGSLFVGKGQISGAPVKGLTKAELIKTENDRYAFISGKQFKTGIYMDYGEFKSQKPSFGQFFVKTDPVTNEIAVHAFTAVDSTLIPVTPWGLAVGNELYVYRDHQRQ